MGFMLTCPADIVCVRGRDGRGCHRFAGFLGSRAGHLRAAALAGSLILRMKNEVAVVLFCTSTCASYLLLSSDEREVTTCQCMMESERVLLSIAPSDDAQWTMALPSASPSAPRLSNTCFVEHSNWKPFATAPPFIQQSLAELLACCLPVSSSCDLNCAISDTPKLLARSIEPPTWRRSVTNNHPAYDATR